MKENLKENVDSKKSNGKILTGMFANRESLNRAYEVLQDRGYAQDEINVIMSDETRTKYFTANDTAFTNQSIENAGKGLAVGGSIGIVFGSIVALVASSLIVPGLGVLVAGPIAIALTGVGVGGVVGGIIGLLVGLEIPEQYAKLYESGIMKGYIVLGVYPHNSDDAEYFKKTWLAYQGEEIYY